MDGVSTYPAGPTTPLSSEAGVSADVSVRPEPDSVRLAAGLRAILRYHAELLHQAIELLAMMTLGSPRLEEQRGKLRTGASGASGHPTTRTIKRRLG